MARITGIEAFEIFPEYRDFNGLYLARTHGRQIQGPYRLHRPHRRRPGGPGGAVGPRRRPRGAAPPLRRHRSVRLDQLAGRPADLHGGLRPDGEDARSAGLEADRGRGCGPGCRWRPGRWRALPRTWQRRCAMPRPRGTAGSSSTSTRCRTSSTRPRRCRKRPRKASASITTSTPTSPSTPSARSCSSSSASRWPAASRTRWTRGTRTATACSRRSASCRSSPTTDPPSSWSGGSATVT